MAKMRFKERPKHVEHTCSC